MKISDILDVKGRDVATVGPNETLNSVFTQLASRKIGALVVADSDMKVLGIVSERDLVRAVAKDGERVLSWPVETVMTKEVVVCGLDETVLEIMAKMTHGRFRHMPVVENRTLVGVVSIGDIVKNRIEEVEREAAEIRAYIHAI